MRVDLRSALRQSLEFFHIGEILVAPGGPLVAMSAALPTAAASRCSGVLLAYGGGFRSPSWTISIVIVTRRAAARARRAARFSSKFTN